MAKGLASSHWGFALLTVALAACSDVPDDGPVCLDGSRSKDCTALAQVLNAGGQLIADKQSVGVPITGLAIGKSADVDLQVVNAASIATAAGLRVTGVTIDWDGHPAPSFTCLTLSGLPCDTLNAAVIVPAGVTGVGRVDHLPFRLRFTRQDLEPRAAVVHVHFAGDFKHAQTQFTLVTQQGSPRLGVSTTAVEFPYVAPGTPPQEKPLLVHNAGDAALTVTRFELSGAKTFAIVLQGIAHAETFAFVPPLVLQPGAELPLQVRFLPDGLQKRLGSVRFFSDDPQQPLGTAVALLGNTAVPCVKLSPTQVLFGQAKVGEKREQKVTISNCGTAPLSVESATLEAGSHPAFGIGTLAPFALPVSAKKDVVVKWNPQAVPKPDATGKPSHDLGTLVVKTSAGPAKATLDGVAVDFLCPVADFKIKEGEEVVPQTTLHLNGLASYSAGGAPVKSYHWTVVQPAGSLQVFLPGPDFVAPKFTPNVVGDYKFCLEVKDVDGKPSCEPKCKTVLVAPGGCATHIELTWDTPGDLEQGDSGPGAGADLDLHVASSLAAGQDLDCDGTGDPWFSNPVDAFWYNAGPNWGSFDANVNDDASLDLDDTDGAGPENMNLGCAMDDTVSIGVHYWNDHGFGTSYATVRVFMGNAKIMDLAKVAMQPLDMWYVAKLTVPMGSSSAGSAPLKICHQSGDACIGFKMPGSSLGGKMWQPAGAWCVTPCYQPLGMSIPATSPANCGP